MSSAPRMVWAAAALAALLGADAAHASAQSMVQIPSGSYAPFERVKPANAAAPAPNIPKAVAAFQLDVEPVTNAEFLAFVAAHPQWRKSQIKSVFADAHYLRRWPSDLVLADAAERDAPVTDVSWFAAEAYCKARGLRLPTTEQWEYALSDDGRGRDAIRERALEWFAAPNEARLPKVGAWPANGFGVRDLVGLVWEWTLDFGADATSLESQGQNAAQFCGGAATGVADTTDYPAFMRYSMRASLKASYTTDNLGFRCAGGAP
jgi:formylglycine-generating enzyme